MIKGINLIPEEIQRQWLLHRVRKAFVVVAVCYLAVLAALYADKRMELNGKLGELASINAEKARLAAKSLEYTTMTAKLAELKRSQESIDKRLALSSGLAADRVPWSGILRRLSNDIPKGVWLRSLSTSDLDSKAAGTGAKKVRLLGSALANSAIASFMRSLENSEYMGDVTLSYTQRRDLDTKTVFDFEVSGLLKAGEVSGGR